MKRILEFIMLHKTGTIIVLVTALIATSIITVSVIEYNSADEKNAVSSAVSLASKSEIFTLQSEYLSSEESSSSSTSYVNIKDIPKEKTEIKPSTGSVLTAPEFSYKSDEDTLENEVNANKYAPAEPQVTPTVTPSTKKIEPTDTDVNVRADAGTGFESLGKVSIGSVFDYLGEKKGTDNMIWYNISGIIGGKQQSGYIRSDYAKFKDETPEAPTIPDNFRFEQKGGNTYCYNNGELLKGYYDINGLRYYFNKETGAKESYTCIDVSRYQQNINWNKVKAAGVDYAIIRVGFRGYEYGGLSIDPYFEQNIKGAKAAGIKCGVYFYSVAKDEVEAVTEANFVLNAVKGYSLDLPIAVDVEHVGDRVSGLSANQRTSNAIAFMETIKQAGKRTMLYTYFNYYNNHLVKSRLTNYTLWMAYYTDNSNLLSGITYDGWQYASDGTVSGISGRCDMNVIFKSMITGNKADNPLIGKKEETKPNTNSSSAPAESSSEPASSSSSEVASGSSSEVATGSSSESSSDNSSEDTSGSSEAASSNSSNTPPESISTT